ncbi:MAG: type II toxin-antitoxin system RelE/ParE family toxin [Eubacterium sp.]
MSKFKAEFFTQQNGSKPAKDFLLSQDVKMRAKLFGLIDILEENGNQLREPYSKPLEDGIFELRAKLGSDITRILYFFFYEGRIILTHGFTKKTQKTPRNEIERAKKYRKEFLEREGK